MNQIYKDIPTDAPVAIPHTRAGTCEKYSKRIRNKMKAHEEHEQHVNFHKQQQWALLEKFTRNEIIVKCDFIQNIAHSRGRETSASYYSKRQTQFFLFVIWYKKKVKCEFVTAKIFIDYLSCYLKHNSLFFSKYIIHLLTHLRNNLALKFNKVSSLSGAPVTELKVHTDLN